MNEHSNVPWDEFMKHIELFHSDRCSIQDNLINCFSIRLNLRVSALKKYGLFMANSTLFIPDISGFTRFVKQTEIKHSQHIIEELINLIIKEGSKTFKVAEIEGDAVFFFRHEETLAPDQVRQEAKKIYQAFHRHLLDYKTRRICNCGACTTASDLELKFVVHTGEIALANFSGDRGKPYGEPVIAAHRLLKTKIGHSEYLLFSEDYPEGQHIDGQGSYEDKELGEIGFNYSFIQHWKEGLESNHIKEGQEQTNLNIEVSGEIEAHIEALHDFITDFRYRHIWNKDAEKIIFDESTLNQVGSEHYCVIDGKNLFFESTRPEVQDSQMAYGEVLKEPAPLKYLQINFILTPVREQLTMVEMKISARVAWWQKPLAGIIRKKLQSNASKTLQLLSSGIDEYLKEVEYED